MQLTASERIILHIAEYWKLVEPSSEMTQKGIAEGAGVLRSHVPRNLKRLIAERSIDEAEGRVAGRGRKVRFYRITEAGLRRAKELRESLLAEKVTHSGSEVTVGYLSRQFGLSPLAVALKTDGSGVFHPPSEEIVSLGGLIERDEDLAFLKKWHREGGPAMVVYGAAGMGKTALGRAFVSQVRQRAVWVDLREGESAEELMADLGLSLGATSARAIAPETVIEHARSEGALFVLDGYDLVSEGVVDFLASAVTGLRESMAKFLVLARETTPSYCRFYGREAVRRGEVWERHLRGLSLEGCQKMLGAEQIDGEALRRIYLLTKGTPLYLDLIRRGDADELRRMSRFTNAEIKLLMFSKGVSPRP